MLPAPLVLTALGALLSITITADDPGDRGLVARRLAEAGHVIVGRGGALRLHITADAIRMSSDGSPPTDEGIPLPRGAARQLVLPHHARALVGPHSAAPVTRPVVWLTGRGAELDRAAAGLLDAGFAIGWREPVLALCIEPGSVAAGRGRDCGPPETSADPVAEAIAHARRLARPPAADPRPAPAPASVMPRLEAQRARPEPTVERPTLRIALGVDSRAAATSGLLIERAARHRWLAGLVIGGDLSAGLRIGLGLKLARWATLDLTGEITLSRDGVGGRVALPLGLGAQTRIAIEPAWTDRGPAVGLVLSWPL